MNSHQSWTAITLRLRCHSSWSANTLRLRCQLAQIAIHLRLQCHPSWITIYLRLRYQLSWIAIHLTSQCYSSTITIYLRLRCQLAQIAIHLRLQFHSSWITLYLRLRCQLSWIAISFTLHGFLASQNVFSRLKKTAERVISGGRNASARQLRPGLSWKRMRDWVASTLQFISTTQIQLCTWLYPQHYLFALSWDKQTAQTRSKDENIIHL